MAKATYSRTEMRTDVLDRLRRQFNDRVSIHERRPGVFQVILPMFHPDGDLYELFLEDKDQDHCLITDLGLTLMRLSYNFDIDTDTKRQIFRKILAEGGAREDKGAIVLEVALDRLYPAILQYVKLVTQVITMQLYRREVVRSLFYENLEEIVATKLSGFLVTRKLKPIEARPELEVDYVFDAKRPLFVFGIKDGAKARLATIACLEVEKGAIPFRSLAVHEDFEALSPTDRSLITNSMDKQFTDLEDFKARAVTYFNREIA
jgi:hypothetical protein